MPKSTNFYVSERKNIKEMSCCKLLKLQILNSLNSKRRGIRAVVKKYTDSDKQLRYWQNVGYVEL